MLLIAGAAVGLWLATDHLKDMIGGTWPDLLEHAIFCVAYVLGGLSLVGPPLLLLTARRRPWGTGRIIWFVSGSVPWLIWPPLISHEIRGYTPNMLSEVLLFPTPLASLSMALALLAGGWLRRSRRRRLWRSWQETFGLLLGIAWSGLGLFLLVLLYLD
jgi:hypothetical protein